MSQMHVLLCRPMLYSLQPMPKLWMKQLLSDYHQFMPILNQSHNYNDY